MIVGVVSIIASLSLLYVQHPELKLNCTGMLCSLD